MNDDTLPFLKRISPKTQAFVATVSAIVVADQIT